MIKIITGFHIKGLPDLLGYEISEIKKQYQIIHWSSQFTNSTFKTFNGQKLIFVNPENNTHPSFQSHLVSEIIEWYNINKKDIIILTHSDHIVNGFLVNIYQEKISNNEIQIEFYDIDNKLIKIPITEKGRIKNAPKGFFDQIDIDLRRMIQKDVSL